MTSVTLSKVNGYKIYLRWSKIVSSNVGFLIAEGNWTSRVKRTAESFKWKRKDFF